jgi:Na+/glutamate symporter
VSGSQVLHTSLQAMGSNLPLFVCSLFGAILLTNLVPRLLPRMQGSLEVKQSSVPETVLASPAVPTSP